MATIILNINGMNCSGCVKSVATVLNGLDGVIGANVGLEKYHAVAEFDAGKIQVAQWIEAVEEVGFDANVALISCFRLPEKRKIENVSA